MAQDELLYFKRPPLPARLMAFNLAPPCQRADLWPIFSQFGLIQSLDVVSGQAFVNYYTCAAAKAALSEIGSKGGAGGGNPGAPTLYGARLNVRRRRATVAVGANSESSTGGDASSDGPIGGFMSNGSDWLSSTDAVAMANCFLGFGGWSTKVVELQELLPDEDDDGNGPNDVNGGGGDGAASAGRAKPVVYREVSASQATPPERRPSVAPAPQLQPNPGGQGRSRGLPPVRLPQPSNAVQRSHWFAVVQLEVPKFGLTVKGYAYGLAGCATTDDALGLAKKAAVGLARVAALRRVCLVLLDGEVRWAHKLPPEATIETSIVWQAPQAPRPPRSELPCMCTETRDSDGDNENEYDFNDRSGGATNTTVSTIFDSGGGASSSSSSSSSSCSSAQSTRGFGPSLRRADLATPLPQPGVGNWRLALALRTASPDAEASKRARLLENLEAPGSGVSDT